ncbi:homeobox-leucine zipper protein ATHB-40-like isoform X2 [Tasmannia lanceolata]|uniref:homeobox-leucine zipper protein ATHB-40-like isoform X2 n=1 Tax=Tasmannia lanceolata TaxID=3420 RepID=UPI004062BA2E
MKMMNLNQVVTLVEEEQMLLFSQCCSDLYTKKPQGEKRVRRKRKKAKREGEGVGWKKRKLSDEQINFLEMNFGSEHKLQSARKYRLAAEIGLEPQQVAVWFQNRRARWKGKKIEEEYLRLKTINEGIVIEKCRLEAEYSSLLFQKMTAFPPRCSSLLCLFPEMKLKRKETVGVEMLRIHCNWLSFNWDG